MTDNNTIEMPVEQFRLLTELAGVSRKVDRDYTHLLGGTARTQAARKAHDRAKNLLREYNND